MYEKSVVLITGGTGSWGQELTRQLLLHNPRQIIIYSRNESSQVKMRMELNDPRLSFCIGDIRDREALVKACRGVNYVFHMAALKHVPICEEQPIEALKTNVTGTKNVIDAAIENDVDKVINVSTDKAVDPANFYGMTKAIGEKLIVEANVHSGGTRFVNVRGGNVLGSSGSVVQRFASQLREHRQIRITDKSMVRFFMTPQSATELLLTAARQGHGGEIFVMMMPACRIVDLAEVMIEASGMRDAEIVETGARPGEKLSEALLSAFESSHAVIWNNRYYVIFPALNLSNLRQQYASCPSVQEQPHLSEHELMTKAQIRRMLEDGGYVPKAVMG